VLSGNGSYEPNGANPPLSTAHWIEEPTWTPDSQQILFLSDLQKSWNINVDAFLLDLQLYQIPIKNPSPSAAQIVAYSVYGDGGLRDPSYRPGHADEIMYTNYEYDTATGTQQVIQVELENANIVQQDLTNNPYDPLYHPGAYGSGNYPSVPITTGTPNVMNLEPSFSPDGNTIAYVRRDNATQMSLYTMPVPNGVTGTNNDPNFNPQDPANLSNALKDYGQSHNLLTGQYLSYPIWSPDGKQIAYYGYNNSTFDLWIANVVKDPKTGSYSIQPGSQVQLTKANGNLDADSRPCWVS
jgi:hypothetical protein